MRRVSLQGAYNYMQVCSQKCGLVAIKCWLTTLVDYRKLSYSALSWSLSCSWDDPCNSGLVYKSPYAPFAYTSWHMYATDIPRCAGYNCILHKQSLLQFVAVLNPPIKPGDNGNMAIMQRKCVLQ